MRPNDFPGVDHCRRTPGRAVGVRPLRQICRRPRICEPGDDEAVDRALRIQATIEQLNACLPPRTAQVRAERGVMARSLLMHTCAEHERSLATTTSGRLRASWHETGTGLIDAIVGLLLAPVTPTPTPPHQVSTGLDRNLGRESALERSKQVLTQPDTDCCCPSH